MKRIGLLSILLGLGIIYANSQDSIVSIPDTAFLYALIDEGVDTNGDNLISYAEAEAVANLHIEGPNGAGRYSDTAIADMTGLEAFKNIKWFSIRSTKITRLDVSQIDSLRILYCNWNDLKELDISNNLLLESLSCWDNELEHLDISNNINLKTLRCRVNNLKELDLTNNPALEELECGDNDFTVLDLSGNPALKKLYGRYFSPKPIYLDSLDVSSNPELEELLVYINSPVIVDLSSNSKLRILECSGEYTSLVIRSNALEELNLYSDQLLTVDLTQYGNLKRLSIHCDSLRSLDLSGNSKILELTIAHASSSIDLTYNTELEVLEIWSPIISLDLSKNPHIKDLSLNGTLIETLDLKYIDELTDLTIWSDTIRNIDLSQNHSLANLEIRGGNLSEIDLSENKEIKFLSIEDSKLTSLNLSENRELLDLDISDNKFLTLDLLNNTKLKSLRCSGNQLTNLDVSNCTELEYLDFGLPAHGYIPYGERQNFLTSLDLSQNLNLLELNCSGNLIRELDVSKNILLERLRCGSNSLKHLDLSQNSSIIDLRCDEMPTLNEVCVWDSFHPDLIYIDTADSPNVNFTTECSDFEAPEIVATDTIYQQEFIEATSTESGVIYLVPEDTENYITLIRGACIDSVDAVANVPVEMFLPGLDNGIYWLYARDSTGNISEPEAFTIMGVGLKNYDTQHIRIYPNPTHTLLTIETEYSDHYSINITSLNGQLIHSEEIVGTTHQLNLSSFHKGVYFITIRSKDFVTTRKIIKM